MIQSTDFFFRLFLPRALLCACAFCWHKLMSLTTDINEANFRCLRAPAQATSQQALSTLNLAMPRFAGTIIYVGAMLQILCAPFVLAITESRTSQRHPIHVAICADRAQLMGLAALVNSILLNSSDDEALFFHIVTTPPDAALITSTLECVLSGHDATFRVYNFGRRMNPKLLKVHSAAHRAYGLNNRLNFARFFLGDILPWSRDKFSKVLYFDTDCLVTTNIAGLYRSMLTRNEDVVLAAATRNSTIDAWVNLTAPAVVAWNEIHPYRLVNASVIAFNAGVLGINLAAWKRLNIFDDCMHWAYANARDPLYLIGSNPPLVLGTVGRVELFEEHWNVADLESRSRRGISNINGKVLHWTGPNKPWLASAEVPMHDLWTRYSLQKCVPSTQLPSQG